MTQDFLYLGVALLLVLLNGFFVATEFAIVKIRPSRIQAMAEEHKPGAVGALRMTSNLDAYLSATQFGITLSSLALGWIGEPAFAHLIEPLVHRVAPDSVAPALTHTIAVGLAFSVITVLHIVVGELAPKSLAIQKAEATTVAVAWPMQMFYLLFYPGIWLLNGAAGMLLRLLGLRPAGETEDAHDEDELRLILASSAQAGAITAERAELLSRALEMVEKTARQVMVPRTRVRFLDLDDSLDENIAAARSSGHTWLLVCRDNLDEVVGVLNAKDLFFLLSRNELRSLSQVQRPVLYVPENVTLEQLLSEFRRRRRQLAVVVDEHGGTSGIVTLSDVVAELVGDVAELGRKVDEVRTLPGGKLELPGSTELDDLEDRLDVDFGVEDGEITTIAGYVMAQLGRIPLAGDRAAVGEFEVVVEQVDGPRVQRVRIEPKVSPKAAAVLPQGRGE